MNNILAQIPFPFDLPEPTAFYLSVYILTFALHQAFMHYVLAGSLYIAFSVIRPGTDFVPRLNRPLGMVLRDWMPFLLSAAITAGIAPLLFIQIVYQHQFYTANLLLWWRWMVVVPVLIVAFYLLYLVKGSMLWKCPFAFRAAVTMGTAASFVFVGFCWTANSLLASSELSWPEVYLTGRLPLVAETVIPRMLVWIGGSFATMSAMTGWQLFARQTLVSHPLIETEARTLGGLAVGGMAVASLAVVISLVQSEPAARSLLTGGRFLPYLMVAAAGLVLQGIGWGILWSLTKFSAVGLSIVSVGCGLSLLGTSVMREGLRVHAIDLTSLAERHAQAATVGGFWVFVVAVAVVVCMIGWCVRMVQRGIAS